MKLLITLLIALSSNLYATTSTPPPPPTPLQEYFSKLSNPNLVGDQELVEHFAKAGSFGECSFRKAVSYSSTCIYTLLLKTGEKVCITGDTNNPVIGLVSPDTLSAPMTKKNYFGFLRVQLASAIGPVAKAARYIRLKFLNYNDNSTNCNFSSSSIPLQIDKTLDQFTVSNTSFYTSSLNSSKLFCKTDILSKSVWNHESCQYETKQSYLPESYCRVIYNRLSKMAAINPTATAPVVSTISAAQEVDLVKQQIAAQYPELENASSKIPVEEVIPADTLIHIEESDNDNINYTNCSGNCLQNIADLHASVQEASGYTAFQVPQELNFSLPENSPTGTPNTNWVTVNAQYQGKITQINLSASSALLEHQLTSTVQINAGSVSCAPQIITVAPLFPQTYEM